MTITLEELCEQIKERVDPDVLVDVMCLTTEELVDRFEDRIEQRFVQLKQLVEE